jgi:hypothetical protein
MAKRYGEIDGAIKEFIEGQKMFFVGSAPLNVNGHVNISPKGLDTFRILGPRTVSYLDLTGSGIESVAHVKENGRIVLMFCSFEGPPKILRLYGQGRVVELGEPEFSSLRANFAEIAGVRSIVVAELTDIIDSCGFGVPLFRYEGQREQHGAWARKIGPQGIEIYQREKNRRSLDGLPGLSSQEPEPTDDA